MAKPRKLVPWIVCAADEPVARLSDEERTQIKEAAGIGFSANSWEKIELARRTYIRIHSVKRTAIEYQTFATRLKLIIEGADDILRGLCGAAPTINGGTTNYPLDTTTVLLMHELTLGERNAHSPFELVSMVHHLRKSASSAMQRTQDWPKQNAWGNDWHGFINLLASVFEDHSMKPTASKTSRAKKPDLSPFVNFVWNIMQTIPKEFHEHTQSQNAMAHAVASSLAFRRRTATAGQIMIAS